jgi:hypothetical protein
MLTATPARTRGALLLSCTRASVAESNRQTLAPDDLQSSGAVLSSRLVSAVGASMFDGPVRPVSTPRDRRLEP